MISGRVFSSTSSQPKKFVKKSAAECAAMKTFEAGELLTGQREHVSMDQEAEERSTDYTDCTDRKPQESAKGTRALLHDILCLLCLFAALISCLCNLCNLWRTPLTQKLAPSQREGRCPYPFGCACNQSHAD